MNGKPLVSIITPCYNGQDFIDKYFKSILDQSYRPIELIFVDDGSNDKTKEIAHSYKQKFEQEKIDFVYLEQKHGGQAKALNNGLKRIKGKYLIWPDSDDLLTYDSIEKRVDFLEKNSQYQFVRSNGIYFDYETKEKIGRISNNENRFEADIFLNLILEKTYCSCGCYMIKVEKLKEIYPDLTILESEAGQNWQILIPYSGRHFCGYIDEDLYEIAVRKDSHSRKKRTLNQIVERYMELKEILLTGVEKSNRMDRPYKEIIETKYYKILLLTYIDYKDKNQAKIMYRHLKEKQQLEEYYICNFLNTFYPIRYNICEVIRLIERILSKIRDALGEI